MANSKEIQYSNNNDQLVFDQMRNNVISLIKKNESNEVTNNSNINKAGVYMLYVNRFDDNNIIPFYIGQTHNFQERHKKHLTEIMALNRLHRECYKNALFSDLYNGRNRPCKIFSYMVNHKCSLKDLHMIILETIDDTNLRLEVEQRYIDELYAPFFGFNQLNSISKGKDFINGTLDKDKYNLIKEKDIYNISAFPTFGYAMYNWYRVCFSFYDTILVKNLKVKIPNEFYEILKNKKQLEQIESRQKAIRQYNGWQAKNEAWNICKNTIDSYFSQMNLKSEDKKKLVVQACLFDNESDINEFKKYFRRYSNKTDDNIFEIIEELHGEEIKPIKQKITDNNQEYYILVEKQKALRSAML